MISPWLFTAVNQQGVKRAKPFQPIRKKALQGTPQPYNDLGMEHMWLLAGVVLGIFLWINAQQPKK
jgi:hypothetical protein